ncbi:MAG: hypothetical protein JNL60_02360 [Bacteroidia bacterium]|nr:hypothetical protein [Bacteroidia bacterium]
MNSALASIGKNLILVGIVIFSSLNFFYTWLNWKELFAVQSFVGLGYIFLSCYEYMNASYKASLPVQRYPYFSSNYIMFRALKTAIFISFAILLYMSDSRVSYMYPICVIIATTEAVILYLKYKNSLCFVNIYANYLLLVQNRFTKLFASEIMIIEFRHEIFYFVKKDRKTVQIKLEHINDRESFVQSINDWINRNNVLVSAESKDKIKELIAS